MFGLTFVYILFSLLAICGVATIWQCNESATGLCCISCIVIITVMGFVASAAINIALILFSWKYAFP